MIGTPMSKIKINGYDIFFPSLVSLLENLSWTNTCNERIIIQIKFIIIVVDWTM